MSTPLPNPPVSAPDTSRGLLGIGGRTFYSLGKYPDFRVLWVGNVGTMLGQWVQFAAQG